MSPHPSLNRCIARQGLLHVMAAHSPLSAIIAEEAGFDGIWASGFELSALYGVPDMSFITMTQHLDMVRAMAGRVTIPIIADIDTGFGNAVNVTHTVREFERAGAAAIVIEDKTFPKVTSLAADGRQELVRTSEFQGKIEAAVATRANQDFLVIARTEALIAGLGQDEAHARAIAYEEAGADLILIHSKKNTPDEIESFARGWTGTVPLVIVPTSYPELDDRRIRALASVAVVIYGNHGVRAAVSAMQDTFRSILADGGAKTASEKIASVEEIFRLQNMQAAKDNEKRFLK